MTAGTHLDWRKIFATLLLLPHVGLAVLASFNLFLDLSVMDLYGMRKLNIIMGSVITTGEVLTCIALLHPGKFSSLGWQSRVRISAAVWNFLNSFWLAYLVLRHTGIDRVQMGEMALAFITLCALLIFAIEEKKS